jgi:hypothetical protein
MNGIEITDRVRGLSGYAVAFLSGLPLLLLVRWIERGLETSLLVSSVVEEGVKFCLFLSLWVFRSLGEGRTPGAKEPEILPFLCIVGFAMAENVLYFFFAPTTAIYQRLLYSYPLHLNTGLLYTWVYLSLRSGDDRSRGNVPRAAVAAFAASLGTAYHFFLNVLAQTAKASTVYPVGVLNLLVLLLLFLVVHRKRIERSLIDAGL